MGAFAGAFGVGDEISPLSDSRALMTVCRVTWIAVLITEVGHLNGICHRRLFARLIREEVQRNLRSGEGFVLVLAPEPLHNFIDIDSLRHDCRTCIDIR